MSHQSNEICAAAHGEAALLLVESLIHGLIEQSGLSRAQALDIVGTALDVRIAIADERGDDPFMPPQAAILLQSIHDSLSGELPNAPPPHG